MISKILRRTACGAAIAVGLASAAHAQEERGGLYIQMDGVLRLGQATLGVFFPMLGQFSNFHGNLNKASGGGR